MRDPFSKLWTKFPKYYLCLFYFMMGLISIFPRISIWVILKNETGLDAGRLTLRIEMISAPWLFTPILAWISDQCPIYGYRRKTYVGIFSFLCSITWIAMIFTKDTLWAFYLVLGLSNLFLCWSHVAMDSLIVERIKKDPELSSSLQTMNSVFRSMGKCSGSVLGAIVLSHDSNSNLIFILTSMIPLMVSIGSFWITDIKISRDHHREKRRNDIRTISKRWKKSLSIMIQGFIGTFMWKYCLWTTSYSIIPGPGSAYFYYYQDIMNMDEFKLQLITFAEEIGTLVGNFVFMYRFRKTHPKVLIVFSTLLVMSCNMWHPVLIFLIDIDNRFKLPLIYLYEAFTEFADALLYRPLYIMAAKMCTTGVEGTSYALVHSIQNVGTFLDGWIAMKMMDWMGVSEGKMEHLWHMSFVCAWLFLIPLNFVNIIPDSIYTIAIEEEEQQEVNRHDRE